MKASSNVRHIFNVSANIGWKKLWFHIANKSVSSSSQFIQMSPHKNEKILIFAIYVCVTGPCSLHGEKSCNSNQHDCSFCRLSSPCIFSAIPYLSILQVQLPISWNNISMYTFPSMYIKFSWSTRYDHHNYFRKFTWERYKVSKFPIFQHMAIIPLPE